MGNNAGRSLTGNGVSAAGAGFPAKGMDQSGIIRDYLLIGQPHAIGAANMQPRLTCVVRRYMPLSW